ncbi:MAG: 3-phosphoshikimate 1-carboxyvinyltransferase [Balneolaceae bacterium]|nr:3-phosphoshikimate 1-carboxyvinyltransferase [Balneolaceae bacterium]
MSESTPQDIPVSGASGLAGTLHLPPDKSIAHRAALFASLSEEDSVIEGYSQAEDPQSTLACLRTLGVEIEVEPSATHPGTQRVLVHGFGRDRWQNIRVDKGDVLDCGNSGTTMRLLLGLLGGAGVNVVLDGDVSLRRRPMGRVLEPLARLGVQSKTGNADGKAPIHLLQREPIPAQKEGQAVRFDLDVASAQVKSALLLAGLFLAEGVAVREPEQSRDHTERMLELDKDDQGWIQTSSLTPCQAINFTVPKDPSAATFWAVLSAIHNHVEIKAPGVGRNPTRVHVFEVLRRMGAQIEWDEVDRSDPKRHVPKVEPHGSLMMQSLQSGHTLKPLTLSGDQIPGVIDEIPALMVAMAFADGISEIRDASELRIKETDRIAAMASVLNAAGVSCQEKPDGMVIHGRPDFCPKPFHVDARHDHRIAMAAAILASCTDPKEAASVIKGGSCASISYPTFYQDLSRLQNGPQAP